MRLLKSWEKHGQCLSVCVFFSHHFTLWTEAKPSWLITNCPLKTFVELLMIVSILFLFYFFTFFIENRKRYGGIVTTLTNENKSFFYYYYSWSHIWPVNVHSSCLLFGYMFSNMKGSLFTSRFQCLLLNFVVDWFWRGCYFLGDDSYSLGNILSFYSWRNL